MARKSTITLNNVELRIYSFDNDVDKKRYYEIYTGTDNHKMFIHQSLRTNKIMKVSVWLDGYNIQLSPKYEYGTALHVFTDLVNKLNK